MAIQPSLRIGDSERDATVAELQEHFAQGRLTLAEFNQRVDAVLAAKTQRDLDQIMSDLPHVRPAGAPLPSSRTRPGRMLSSSQPAAAIGARRPAAAGGPSSAAAWPAPGWSGSDHAGWSGHAHRHQGGGYAVLLTVLAALASWFLVMDYMLAGLRWFPVPGKIGIFLAVFGILRGLVRRIFRGGRTR
jgi:hypothetical protein